MQTLASFKSVFKPRTTLVPWPNPKESIGAQIYFPAIPKRYSCWKAIGPASKIYEEELAEAVTQYLDTCLASPTHAVWLSLCMVGKTEDLAAPYIFFICKDKNTRRKARELVRESLIMQNERFSRFRLGESPTPPKEPEELADQHPTPVRYARGNNFAKEIKGYDAGVYVPRGTDAIRPGTTIFIFSDVGEGRLPPATATVGAVLYSGTNRFLLTAGHPFETPNPEQALLGGTYNEPGILDSEDLECDFDGLSDTEEEPYTEEEGELLSIASQSSNDGPGDSDFSMHSSLTKESTGTSSQQSPSALDPNILVSAQVTNGPKINPLPSPPMDIGDMIGELLFSGSKDRLDYGLVEIKKTNIHATNRLFVPNAPYLEILNIGSMDPNRSVNVRVATSSSGVLGGTLKPAVVRICLPGSDHFEKVHIAHLGGTLARGDCGAPVVGSNGILYGVVLGGNQGTGICYMISAEAIMADLRNRHHKKVALTPQLAFSNAKPRNVVATLTSAERIALDQLKHDIRHALVHGKFGPFLPYFKLQEIHARIDQYRLLRPVTPDRSMLSRNIIDKISALYQRIFTIFLLIGRGDCIYSFLSHDHLDDSKLPFVSDKTWPVECKSGFQDFANLQWQFCPLKFDDDKTSIESLHSKMVLPIIQRDERKGVVELYGDIGECSKSGFQTNRFVLKSYEERGQSSKIEQIVSEYWDLCSSGHSNVLKYRSRLYRAWKQNRKLYLLFEENGTVSLRDYFRVTEPPHNPQDLITFWRSVVKLLVPLQANHDWIKNFTHESTLKGSPCETPDVHPLLAFDQDINPKNIFVSSGQTSNPYDITFKLGLDLDRFDVDKKSERTYVKMYKPPEVWRYNSSSNSCPLLEVPRWDVWSLGCIFSEAVVWTVLGPNGPEVYLNRRVHQYADTLGGPGRRGYFHNGQVVSPAVLKIHDQILGRSTQPIIQSIVRLTEDMLGNLESRPDVVSLHERCKIFNATDLAIAALGIGFSQRISIHRSYSNTRRRRPISELIHHFFTRQLSRPNPASANDSPYETLAFDHMTLSNAYDDRAEAPLPAPKTKYQQVNERGKVMQSRSSHMSIDEAEYWIQISAAEGKGSKKGQDIIKPCRNIFTGEYLKRLKSRDMIFLIDDSSSMKDHWDSVTRVVEDLAWLVNQSDDDGIEIDFTNSPDRPQKWDRRRNRDRMSMRKNHCQGRCDIKSLASNIQLWYERSHKNLRRVPNDIPHHKQKKGLQVYVLTDGEWQDKPGVGELDSVMDIVRKYQYMMAANEHSLGIQFIRFGNSERGIERVRHLDSILDSTKNSILRDIIDTEPWDGNVWKMLLGSFSDEVLKEEWRKSSK